MDDNSTAAVKDIMDSCEALIKGLRQQARCAREQTLEELESAVREAALRLGQALMALALRERQRYEPAPVCGHCGGATVRHEARARTVGTLVGAVEVGVLSFRCSGCGKVTPGALRGELVHGCTPGLARCAARQGARLAFRQAEGVFRDFGLSASDNLIADLTQAVGGTLLAEQAAEAAAVAAGTVELAPAAPPERLYLEADGFMAQVSDGPRGKPGEDWHEVRAGLCFTTAARGPDSAGQPPPPQGFSCRAIWGPCEAFDRWFYPEAQRQGVNQAGEVVLLCDGAPWLAAHLREYVRPGTKVVAVLDWYHATENLAKAVRARYPLDKEQFAACYQRLKAALWQGRIAAVVRVLAQWLRHGQGPATELRQVVGYLWSNRSRMRYPRLRAAGYHIGSGQIESLCKQLGQRVKGADRLWRRHGLAAVLALRCQLISEQHHLPRAA